MSIVRHHGPSGHNNHYRKLAVGLAAHYASRATDEAYSYGKRYAVRKLEEVFKHSMKNEKHKTPMSSGRIQYDKISNQSKKHRAAKTQHTAYIDSVELEATGCEHSTFNYSKPAPKKVHLLEALSRPVIHREIRSGQLNGPSGECSYLEIATADRFSVGARVNEAITQAQSTSVPTSAINTQVFYKAVNFKRTFTNAHNESLWILWHEWMPKIAQNSSPSNLALIQSGQEGTTNSSTTGTGIYFPDNDLLKFKEVRLNYTCLHRRRFYLKPGETLVLYSNYHINKMVSSNFISTDSIAAMVPMFTPRATFQTQGASISQNAGTSTLCKTFIRFVERMEQITIPYPLPQTKLSRFDTTNALPVTAIAASTSHINVDTGLGENDGDQ